jgi:murein DD-endopeptidase MepM/ murein hydrolase activator NlpD
MSSGSHPTANDVRTDRRDPRHERRAAPQPHHRAEHPDPRQRTDHRAEHHRAERVEHPRAEHSSERHGAETAKRKPAKPAVSAKPATAAKPQERGAFTVGHAGRQVRIGPVAFWTVVGSLVIMAGWSVMTATYFAFQDDVLTRMISHEAEMQSAYEDRIAEMRAQVDRVTSRHMLEQEQIEQKLEQIVHRQSLLEQRATSLGTVADPAATGSVRPPRNGPATPKASPISMPAPVRAPQDMRADLRADAGGGFMLASVTPVQRPPLEGVMARVEDSLDRIEGRQVNTLASLEETYDAKARRMRAVLTEVGIDTGKHVEPATGGPFVSYRLSASASTFEKQVYRINVARAQVERLNTAVAAMPLRRPVHGEIDMTSSFGVRLDPFLSRPAMHTGIDFRGDTGEAIHVTAGGKVVSAGWSGGYGRMIEVDHGNGLATRYGHLSEIDVQVGQIVKAGQTVGRMGSTGRSTGPHLHYETRIDGEAVNPQKFLHAGAKFGLI